MTSEPIVRVGVVGLGMGRQHIEQFQKSPRARVEAICDLNPLLLRQTADDFAIPHTFEDFDEFLARAEIDAVALVVPNFLHHPMALKALERGLHVMGEKPMAMDAREAREIREAVRRSGRRFMVHSSQRFQPEYQFFKSLIGEGKLGNLYYANAGWRRMRGLPASGGWYGVKAKSGGNPLIDLGVHLLDLTRWLMGNPKAVTVSACTFARLGEGEAQPKAVDELASALIRFDNGACLLLEVSWVLNFEEREKVYLELSGLKGGLSSITYDYRDTTTCLFHEENGVMVKTVPLHYPNALESAQEHFIRCILEDREPEANADDGLEIMRILDAIYESARIGREIELRHVDLTVEMPPGPAIPASEPFLLDVAVAEANIPANGLASE
ncbi:MAG: Gfo/Idh/MocA family oxidoreductase [Verrucomicrobiota bacterium]